MRIEIPREYEGREQTFLKHRVLCEYLDVWALKRGSTGRFKRVRLWYVDCFAGPWQAQHEDLLDTSVAIGLRALENAAEVWRQQGAQVTLSAIFVEAERNAHERLQAFLRERGGPVETIAIHSEFGAAVPLINERIGHDPAFLFVDPTGWKGAAMRFISPLARVRGRDVLVNVMFNHINRFIDDPREFLRVQMREFFGLADDDVPQAMSEEEMFALYRRRLREQCHVRYAADLAIPHPTRDRTWFRLVVGGHHPVVVELFRDIERRVCGAEAAAVRDQAQHRGDRQARLGLEVEQDDRAYERLHATSLLAARRDVLHRLTGGSQLYGDLWPEILSNCHITKADLNELVWTMRTGGALRIRGVTPRQRTPKDSNRIELAH